MQKIYAGDVLELRNGCEFCVEECEYNATSDYAYKVWGYFRRGGKEQYLSFSPNLSYLANTENPMDVVRIRSGLCSLHNLSCVTIVDQTFGEF